MDLIIGLYLSKKGLMNTKNMKSAKLQLFIEITKKKVVKNWKLFIMFMINEVRHLFITCATETEAKNLTQRFDQKLWKIRLYLITPLMTKLWRNKALSNNQGALIKFFMGWVYHPHI